MLTSGRRAPLAGAITGALGVAPDRRARQMHRPLSPRQNSGSLAHEWRAVLRRARRPRAAVVGGIETRHSALSGFSESDRERAYSVFECHARALIRAMSMPTRGVILHFRSFPASNSNISEHYLI